VAVIPSDPAEVTLFSRTQNFTPSTDYDIAQAQFTSIVQSQAIARQTLAEFGVKMTPAELLSSISVARDPIGDRVNVSVTTARPDDAEKLLGKQVELAVEEFRKTRTRQPEAMQKFLETELEAAERDLDAVQADLQRFKLDNSVESLDRELTGEQDLVRSLRIQQEEAEAEAQRLEALAAALEQQSKEAQGQAVTFDAKSADAAYWRSLAQDLATAAINRRVEAAGQSARKTGAATRLAQHETNLKALITLAEQHQTLQDILKQRQDNRDFIAGKLRETSLRQDQADAVGYLQVLGVPTTPKTQLPSRTLQIALLGAAAGILAGIVLVFFLEFLEQSLKRKPNDKATRA
jgi:capsular polysaccharide biosynthesis protein